MMVTAPLFPPDAGDGSPPAAQGNRGTFRREAGRAFRAERQLPRSVHHIREELHRKRASEEPHVSGLPGACVSGWVQRTKWYTVIHPTPRTVGSAGGGGQQRLVAGHLLEYIPHFTLCNLQTEYIRINGTACTFSSCARPAAGRALSGRAMASFSSRITATSDTATESS